MRATARAALGLTAAAALAAAGCGGSSSSDDKAASAPPTAAAATTPAGTGTVDAITWGLPYGEPTTLDPVKAGDYSPNTVLANVCEPLVRQNPDYSLSPGLAESWKQDQKQVVYQLRSGVKFSSGATMTADDVVASLKRNLDPKQQPVNGDFFTRVKSIEATGPLEVTVSFSEPDELFHKAMSTVMGQVSEAVAVREAGKKYGTPSSLPVCTGPYAVASWKAGSGITLQAREDYWDPKLKPKVGRVEFKFLSDSSTLTNALLSGSIDGTYEAPSTSLRTLQKASSGKLYLGPSTQVHSLGVANPDSPLNDPDLIDALDKAIDREALIRNVYQGAATPQRGIVPPASFGQGEAAKVYQAGYDALPDNTKPDVEAAKQLVAKAGGAPKRALALALMAGDQASLQEATFIQASAKAIGLNLTLKQMPPTEFSSLFYDPTKREAVDLVLTGGYLEIPDPLSYARLIVPKDAIFNWTGHSNAEAERLLAQSQAALDPVESAKAFVAASEVYEPELRGVPLTSPYERLFMNKRITGAPASFAYINLPWAAMIGAAGS